MEAHNDKGEEKRSSLSLESRKRLTLTGVVEVLSFDDEKILLNTCLGMLTIKGESLKMNKLDVQNGDVIIVGHILSLVYSSADDNKKNGQDSIIARLFR